jgi:anti-anti-sigma factor
VRRIHVDTHARDNNMVEMSSLCNRAARGLTTVGGAVEVFEDHVSGVPLLRVEGFVDHVAAPILEGAVARALKDSDSRILIDLSECGYLDSRALSVLLHVLRQVQGKGWLGVLGPDPNLQRLFDIVGLTSSKWFRLFREAEQAGAALVESSPAC